MYKMYIQCIVSQLPYISEWKREIGLAQSEAGSLEWTH